MRRNIYEIDIYWVKLRDVKHWFVSRDNFSQSTVTVALILFAVCFNDSIRLIHTQRLNIEWSFIVTLRSSDNSYSFSDFETEILQENEKRYIN